MQAIILAGGLGTRLRSVVADKPKPMAYVAGNPFLEYQIAFLKRYQIVDLIFCVGYLHEQIQQHFGCGEKWGVNINYAIEPELLGTAGALRNAEGYLNGSFLVLNGDSYFDVDLNKLIQFHRDKKAREQNCLGTLALTEVAETSRYGTISVNQDSRILRFSEKSAPASASSQINAGIYVLETEILQFIPPSQKVSLEREIFPAILANGHLLFGCPLNGFFVDIGTPEGYHLFKRYIEERAHDHSK